MRGNLYSPQPLTKKAKTNFCSTLKTIKERQRQTEAATCKNLLV